MVYESPHPSSPFRQQVPEILPEVLKPLRYCEFRKDEGVCNIFACAVIMDMPFCFQHAKLIAGELANEGTGG